MIEMGGCDLCGGFCASEADNYRTAERHNLLAERLQDCGGGHVGPWHGARGEPLRTCAWCREAAAYRYRGSSLDHSDCVRCRAVRPMRPRRPPRGWHHRPSSSSGPGAVEGLGDAPLDGAPLEAGPSWDLEPRLLDGVESTEPADRARAERALRTYLGRESVRVRWYDSPVELGRVFDEAVRAAGLDPEPPEGEVPPWSLWAMARGALRRWLVDPSLQIDRRVTGAVDRVNGRATRIASAVSDCATPPGAEHFLPTSDAGQWDTQGRALDAIGAVSGETIPDGGLLQLMRELRASSGPVLVFGGAVHLLERPLAVRLDDQGRLHSEHGPALAYPDGTAAWALHGVVVPRHVVSQPDRITVDEIDAQDNVEVRRVMVERFGADRLVREGGAELVHEDAAGRLWRRPMPGNRWGEEPVVMVEVVNSTPEPDGSHRRYFLRVPPTTRTATAAVAWTFGIEDGWYAPVRET